MSAAVLALLAGAPLAWAAEAALPAHAPSTAPLTLELIRTRWAELDTRAGSLSCAFRQSVLSDGAGAPEREGEILWKKPNRFRLTLRRPELQTTITDGTWVWTHRPAAKQAIRTRGSARRQAPGGLGGGLLELGRLSSLLADYAAALSAVSPPGPDGHRSFVLTLTPRPEDRRRDDAGFSLTLTASDRDFFPAEAVLSGGGTSLRTLLTDARLNPPAAEEDFRFTPPPGTDVFEDIP